MCAIAAIGVAGQGDPNTRLGLLATELGIDPVPGAQPGGKYCLLNLMWMQSKATGKHVQQ